MRESVRMAFVRSRNKDQKGNYGVNRMMEIKYEWKERVRESVGSALVRICIMVYMDKMNIGYKMGVRESIVYDKRKYMLQ